MTAFRGSGDLAADRRFLWAEACARDGDAAGAADLFRQALELAPGWAAAWFALGEALASMGDTSGALAAFDACLSLAPEDAFGASLRRARLSGSTSPTAMPARYVAQLFDDYAARFDEHLTKALNYRGPAILMAALDAACPGNARAFQFAEVLDLGCGTGLMAVALGKHAGQIDGIDLSRAMLEQAALTGRYRSLAAEDVTTFLMKAATPAYDLIIAADVFVYLGDLGAVIAAAAPRIAPDGLLAFTVQHHAGDGYILGGDMRFAHSVVHVAGAAEAAGLRVILDEPAVTRQDAGRDVPGRVMVLARKG